jgi:predicted RNA binding protein YcfA (HicA-like mRNA interferase family)
MMRRERFQTGVDRPSQVRLTLNAEPLSEVATLELKGTNDNGSPSMDTAIILRTRNREENLTFDEHGFIEIEGTREEFQDLECLESETCQRLFSNIICDPESDLANCTISHTSSKTLLDFEGLAKPIELDLIRTEDDFYDLISRLSGLECEQTRGNTISLRTFVKSLKKLGIQVIYGGGGKHPQKAIHPETGQKIPIPFHVSGKDLGKGLVKAICKSLGISLDKFY